MKSPNAYTTSFERAPQNDGRSNRLLKTTVLLLAVCPILFCSCQSSKSGFSRSAAKGNPYSQFDPTTPEEEAYYRDVYSGDWREQNDPSGFGKSIAKHSGSTTMPPHWETVPHGAKTLEEIRAESSRQRTSMALSSANPYPLTPQTSNYAPASTRETYSSQVSYSAPQVPETPQVVVEQQPVYGPQQPAYAAQPYAAQQQQYVAQQAVQSYAVPQQSAPTYAAPQQAVPTYAAPQQSVPTYAAPQQAVQPAYSAQQVPAQQAPAQAAPAYTPSNYQGASVERDSLDSLGEKVWIVRGQEPVAEKSGVEIKRENVKSRVASRASVALDESRPGGVSVKPNVVDPSIAAPYANVRRAAPNPSAPANANAPRDSYDEYVVDGGDSKGKIVAHDDWLVENLDPEDAAAHFDTVDGRILTEPANRVFLYSPRFGAVRQIVTPIEGDHRDSVNTTTSVEGVVEQTDSVKIDVRSQEEKLLSATGSQEIAGAESALAPTTAIGRIGVIEADGLLRMHQMLTSDSIDSLGTEDSALIMDGAIAAQGWSGRQGLAVATDQTNVFSNVYVDGPATVYAIKDGTTTSKLRVVKIANKDAARPGEFVEFTLRFENIGDEPIGNVTILDNLSARLRYVDGTAKSSVPAEFLADLSESGSLILRWEITDPLQPKEFGVVRVICKVQ
ncbi:MAG: DUF11 domain-containing protein [Thermoguttaceae bacterium]|nr:DUF11 domain-containing protein [Thermoguttaceae bacterium]